MRYPGRSPLGWAAAWALGAVGVAVFVFLLAPIVLVAIMSLGPADVLRFPPERLSLDQYRAYFGRAPWVASTLLSIEIAGAVTALSVVLGIPAALALDRLRIPQKDALYGAILSPIIIPRVVIAVALYGFLATLGLVGSRLGLVIAHTALGIPFVVLTVSAALRGFDRSLENAARSLGANGLRAFFLVTFPLIRPAVISGALFAFILSFDEVVIALFLSSPTVVPLTKRMWDGIFWGFEPTLPAISTLLVLLVIAVLTAVEALRRRAEARTGPPG